MNLEAESSDKRILCVGLICLDIVTVCKQYPEEDSDQRSLDYYWQRGGNASNSSTVLALLGAMVECLGTLVEGPEAQFLTSDLQKYGIVTDNCVRIPAGEGKPPVAICVISEATGSRTILAALSGYREVTFEDFDKLDLTKYRWIHFEGRPRNSIDRMMSKLHDYNESVSEIDDRITVSLELEKTTRPDLKCLMDKADVVFFSKDFAKMEGYTCKEDAVTGFAHNCRQGSLDYYWQRGGNASNSSTVLALLGARVECLGTLVEGPEAQFLTSDLQKYGIVTDNCVRIPAGEGKPPVAICVISEATGSRTILAALSGYREVTFEDLDKLDLTKYRWIHFEGRPRNSIDRMMSKLHDYNESVSEIDDRITVSLELEKTTRPDLKCLMDKADVVFFSKDFAKMEGYTCKEDAVTGFAHNCRQGATAICAWGEDGAAAKSSSGDIVTSPVFPPENLCDTLGAGDTFNAATIFALSQGKTVKDAVTFGCRVAGAKCGMKGYSGIQGMQALLCGSVQLADN